MLKSALVGALLGAALTAPVAAATLYSNGPGNYASNAWNISGTLAVANSFTLERRAVVTGFTFDSWTTGLSDLRSIRWSISPAAFGTLTTSFLPDRVQYLRTNALGFVINRNSIAVGAVTLNAGTYWLTLQEGVTYGQQRIYWDINSGPSQAVQVYTGNLAGRCPLGGTCSSTFTIEGYAAVPEPASWALMIAGFGLVGTAMRRRTAAAA